MNLHLDHELDEFRLGHRVHGKGPLHRVIGVSTEHLLLGYRADVLEYENGPFYESPFDVSDISKRYQRERHSSLLRVCYSKVIFFYIFHDKVILLQLRVL